MSKHEELYAFDRAIEAQGAAVVGLDEVGRGPLAGPVVAAAVRLDLGVALGGVNDSKKLSASRRDALYAALTAGAAVAWATGAATVEEIERLNILQASLLAMRRALEQIGVPWSLALVDGNQPIPSLAHERQRTIVKGDGLSASIAAASIIAKVTRDRLMDEYHRTFPAYEFNRHKGYGSPLHIQRICELGLCPIHRASFCHRLVALHAPGTAERKATP
jgi:ribonuclease HII